MATSNQQPATSNQQPATSNQQPATSNQQPATSFLVWKTLVNGQKVEAEVEIPTRWNLHGKFAQWANCFGCTIEEALAMFFADDRAELSFMFGIEKGKRLVESGFSKIEGEKIPTLTYFSKPFKFDFSMPDKYNERHAHIELPLNIKQNRGYITLQINGWEPHVYLFEFSDMGTVGYARMNNQWAVGGKMTNISMNWATDSTTYGIINVIGTIDNGMGKLHLWLTK